jgi:alpha-galactosidase
VLPVFDEPTEVLVAAEDWGELRSASDEVRLEVAADDAVSVFVRSSGPLSRIVLRWPFARPEDAFVLGDAWERTYGEQAWRLDPPEVLPWYLLVHAQVVSRTIGVGVRVRPNAFCAWSVSDGFLSLHLNVRNGGSAVLLGDRELEAATIVHVAGEPGESPWSVHERLCAAMCSDPLPSRGPLVGANNWYYAYGENFGPSNVLGDARTVVELADGHPVRPYSVVDAGWSPGGSAPGGPWTAGVPGLFDDMAGLAAAVAEAGAVPGIWFRPASLSTVSDPSLLRPGPRPVREQPLDLSLPAVLDLVREDTSRLVGWGYQFLKHDFSTFDMFARWGPAMSFGLTDDGWSFADRSSTNAELLLRFYRAIREAAGSAVVLGCNVVGHLAAGLVDAQRTGDDTSGREWERTRTMGVNTLAFRLAQHGRFFALDADCVPATPQTPWSQNRQFLDLVARSGTALFVSVDPAARNDHVDADLSAALRLALDGGVPGGVEPLDWLETPQPRLWRSGETSVRYDWSAPDDGSESP